jgi:glycine/D-amino acid oxidase-like deaminating enzyme
LAFGEEECLIAVAITSSEVFSNKPVKAIEKKIVCAIEKGRWGKSPWTIDFRPAPRVLPEEVDVAVVGGGFTGLATAAWLRHFAPQKSVAVFEAATIGAGSSGHTGGMALAESSVGDLPGLGDVLGGFADALRVFEVDCDFILPGVWEISHKRAMPDSPIHWSDSGELRAAKEVPGGSVDAGKLISGLGRAAECFGASICENAPVEDVTFGEPMRLTVAGKSVLAHGALFATNAQSLELSGLMEMAESKFTTAVATEPLTSAQLEALGLTSRKPFYTTDFPYLWGRSLSNGGMVFGGGLANLDDWRELSAVDIAEGEVAGFIARLELRVRSLVPAMSAVEFTHRWGGPMGVGPGWRPVFIPHPRSSRALVLGAYSGQGVTLSVHLGRWAAEALLGRRELPNWKMD